MTDQMLLELLRSDPDEGLRQLIRQYSGLVFSVVSGRLAEVCDSSEIEDCVTDVFISFHTHLDSFVPKTSLKNYLCVIARNAAAGLARNRLACDSIDDEDFSVDIPDGSDVSEKAAERQLLENVFAEIKSLGHPDSDILIRKYYFGYSSRDIASSLGMSVSNVDTRAHRAIRSLRAKFGGNNG